MQTQPLGVIFKNPTATVSGINRKLNADESHSLGALEALLSNINVKFPNKVRPLFASQWSRPRILVGFETDDTRVKDEIQRVVGVKPKEFNGSRYVYDTDALETCVEFQRKIVFEKASRFNLGSLTTDTNLSLDGRVVKLGTLVPDKLPKLLGLKNKMEAAAQGITLYLIREQNRFILAGFSVHSSEAHAYLANHGLVAQIPNPDTSGYSWDRPRTVDEPYENGKNYGLDTLHLLMTHAQTGGMANGRINVGGASAAR